LHKKKAVYAVDCDEVLVNINQKWFDLMMSNKKVIEYIKDVNIPFTGPDKNDFLRELLTVPININYREQYYIEEWLFENKHPQEIKDIAYNVYFNNNTFYDDLPPSKFFMALYNMLRGDILERIVVVTHALDKTLPVNKSKMRWLAKQFKEAGDIVDLDFFLLDHHETKSQCINQEVSNYNAFVDDSLKNIRDVIENTNSYGKEFFIPLYGYNMDFPEAPDHKLNKDLGIIYFNND